MNEELLQQAIYQLKMFKDIKIEAVSIENTDYVDGTTRFSVEVTYEDELHLENVEATAGDYNVVLEYDSEGLKQFIKDNLNKFVKIKY